MSHTDQTADRNQQLFERAQRSIPGGVNSPVRAFRGVGGTPIFFKRGEGAYLYDEDDHRYLDYVGSWGPMIVGHTHPKVVAAMQAALERGLIERAAATLAEAVAGADVLPGPCMSLVIDHLSRAVGADVDLGLGKVKDPARITAALTALRTEAPQLFRAAGSPVTPAPLAALPPPAPAAGATNTPSTPKLSTFDIWRRAPVSAVKQALAGHKQ
jgi:hypothetical protein